MVRARARKVRGDTVPSSGHCRRITDGSAGWKLGEVMDGGGCCVPTRAREGCRGPGLDSGFPMRSLLWRGEKKKKELEWREGVRGEERAGTSGSDLCL